MAERRVNAVVTIRIPLDLPSHASREEKLRAACDAADRIECDEATTVWIEDVEDGEPIRCRGVGR